LHVDMGNPEYTLNECEYSEVAGYGDTKTADDNCLPVDSLGDGHDRIHTNTDAGVRLNIRNHLW